MFSSLRSVRIQPPLLFSSFILPYNTVRPTSVVRFRQAAAGINHHPSDHNTKEMEQSQPQPQPQPENKKGDVMSHSFGEGYATRCDDEGFGGIYAGNQSLPGGDEDLGVHVDAPGEYDKNQGSEVKEREKGRHQPHAQAS